MLRCIRMMAMREEQQRMTAAGGNLLNAFEFPWWFLRFACRRHIIAFAKRAFVRLFMSTGSNWIQSTKCDTRQTDNSYFIYHIQCTTI